jgi:hypothetical protein
LRKIEPIFHRRTVATAAASNAGWLETQTLFKVLQNTLQIIQERERGTKQNRIEENEKE